MDLDLLIKDGLICTEDAPPFSGSVGVHEGRILIVAESADGLGAEEVIDAEGRLVISG